jgi:hypothetical protein
MTTLFSVCAGCANDLSTSAKAIKAFSFLSPAASGTIDEANYAIAVAVPYETNLTALVPIINHTGVSIVRNGVSRRISPIR